MFFHSNRIISSQKPPYRLIPEIINRSIANTWPNAKREWYLENIFTTDSACPGKCLCGHSPILEHCVLRNRMNGHTVVVGNFCVTRFLELGSEELFTAFRKIRKNPHAALCAKAIDYVYDRGWIDKYQRVFYLNTRGKTTRGKKKLTPKQLAFRIQINEWILSKLTPGEGSSHA